MSALSKDEFLALNDKAREELVAKELKEIGILNLRFLSKIIEPNVPAYRAFVERIKSLDSKAGGALKKRHRKLKTRKSKKRNN